jgi:hypothetical protein
MSVRPRLPLRGSRAATGPSIINLDDMPLEAIDLDRLTVAGANQFLDQITDEPNVPPRVKRGLKALYR